MRPEMFYTDSLFLPRGIKSSFLWQQHWTLVPWEQETLTCSILHSQGYRSNSLACIGCFIIFTAVPVYTGCARIYTVVSGCFKILTLVPPLQGVSEYAQQSWIYRELKNWVCIVLQSHWFNHSVLVSACFHFFLFDFFILSYRRILRL